MSLLSTAQGWIVLVLSLAALGVEIYAFADCARRRGDAFTAAGKRTKGFWMAVTGVAAAVGFVSIGALGGILAIVAVIAAGVYLADVKPALDQVMGKGRSNDGPYGPW
jgi:hypothetical protein